ncbi:MAG: hypothetical protein ACLPUO_15130 [Streptosporangiaceae bacterium]|jgi:hypothetical protein
MYQAYPGGAQMPEQQRPAPPQSVLTAVKLMYAGAAVSVLGLIISLATVGSVKSAIRSADPTYTSSQLHAAEVLIITVAVIEALVGVGLWLWMAWANKRGRNWARIVATVLFALNTLGLVLNLARPHTIIGTVYSTVLWLIGLSAIILLWRKESSPYFAAPKI